MNGWTVVVWSCGVVWVVGVSALARQLKDGLLEVRTFQKSKGRSEAFITQHICSRDNRLLCLSFSPLGSVRDIGHQSVILTSPKRASDAPVTAGHITANFRSENGNGTPWRLPGVGRR